jgi:NAD(P)-dependent dehydrogenase (short-subunit alcohol dehydrogenase family)
MSQSKWGITDINDQKGKIAIVTGASSGIGLETARVLALKKATVIQAVRSMDKGRRALNKIKEQNEKADIIVMELDLANLKSIREFTEKIKRQYNRLDLLINNAGVMVPPYSKTKDGFELQFGTNHLSHFALSGLLLDLLRKTPESRIVNVSSNAHKMGNLNFNDLNWEYRKYKKMKSYGDSKLANLYFTFELKRRLHKNGDNPLVMASHPGWAATELQRHTRFINFMNTFFAQDAKIGALPTLYAATADDVESGNYYGPDGFMEMRGYPTKVDSSELSKDPEVAQKLWDVSEELTGVKITI